MIIFQRNDLHLLNGQIIRHPHNTPLLNKYIINLQMFQIILLSLDDQVSIYFIFTFIIFISVKKRLGSWIIFFMIYLIALF